jgi:peptidoglycan lytic transglycosylase G
MGARPDRFMKRLAIVPLLALAALVGAVFSMASARMAPAEQTTLEIPFGMPTIEIAKLLAEKGVVRSAWHFWSARVLRPGTVLQAGEYQFIGPASASDVVDRLIRGDVHYYSITAPEGSNVFDIAELVGRVDFLTEEGFLAAARNPALIQDIDPQAQTLEGYLFPSTYHVTRNMTEEDVARQMVAEFRRVWTKIGDGESVHDTVTLASLVEKETGVDEERGLVASVFENRLERGMRLQCDPTAIYAALLEGRYNGVIRRSDLDDPHPYNTYQHAGLPPGPIANPGEASLRAALKPPDTKFLFFVAQPDSAGGHVFSATAAEHSRAVGQYRRGVQEQREARRKAQREAARVAGK